MKAKESLRLVVDVLPVDVKRSINMLSANLKSEIREILLRTGKAVMLLCGDELLYLRNYGRYGTLPSPDNIVMSEDMMRRTFMNMCNDSVYSYMDNLNSGFLTLPGGSRVGICGRFVSSVSGKNSVRNISSLLIRISGEYDGIADVIIGIYKKYGIGTTLLVGPPCSGKTTMLRDLCRSLSDGALSRSYKVSLIDERSEISGAYEEKFAFDLGVNTDIYLNYKKKDAILMSLRTMSPDVIIFDEIGDEHEVMAVREGMNSGIKFIFTIHADCYDELVRKEQYKLLEEYTDIKYLVFLKRDYPGVINEVMMRDEGNNFIFCNDTCHTGWTVCSPKSIQTNCSFVGNEEVAS